MWLICVSVVTQSLIFFCVLFTYPTLIDVAIWVIQVPVVIIWLLAALVPLVFVRPLSIRAYLGACAKQGWIFAIAAIVWGQAYWKYSESEGVPVSWTRVEERRRDMESRERQIREIQDNIGKQLASIESAPSELNGFRLGDYSFVTYGMKNGVLIGQIEYDVATGSEHKDIMITWHKHDSAYSIIRIEQVLANGSRRLLWLASRR